MSTVSVTNLKNAASASNNLVFDNAGNTTAAGTVAMGSSFLRNRIINGAMVIDQRNGGASFTNAGYNYTLDRWLSTNSQNSKYTVQQNAGSVTPPSGFTNYLGITSTSSYSLLTADYFGIAQPIEGFNVADLGWGTASAQTVTLSFWARSSLTGTFGGSVYNSTGTRSYPFSYTISSANTWERKTVTIPGDTTGTWLTNNGVGLTLLFTYGVGATYSGTANAWAGAFYLAPTGATSVVGTNGATFYLTGVQLEVGTVATPFERRLYGTELALCQRYLPAFIPTSTGTGQGPVGQSYAATNALVAIPFQVPARVFPTGISVTNATNFAVTQANTTRSTASAVNFNGGSPYGGVIDVAVASGLVAGSATVLWVNTLPCQILFTGCEL